MKRIKLSISLVLLSTVLASAATFNVKDYNAKGDGVTDDGAAIQSALVALYASSDNANTLLFEAGKEYYANAIDGTYLMDISGKNNITIDGNASTFLLGSAVRFILADNTTDITIQNLSVDYKPLPFFEGDVVAVNSSAAKKYVDIKVDAAFEMPLLGVHNRYPNEQAYFGYMWSDLNNSVTGKDYGAGHHYYVTEVAETYAGSIADRIVRVYTGGKSEYKSWKYVTANETRATIPIEGVAHIGANAVFDIVECNNVLVKDVNIWSAPWFATRLRRNSGFLTFDNVDIAPKEGTNRRLSSWRDGIHAKSNSAILLFQDCLLNGMADDAFNIASFMSDLTRTFSSTKINVKQHYPLNIVPFSPGDLIQVYDVVKGKYVGRSRVSSSSGFAQTGQTGKARAPTITINLQTPIEEMNEGCVLWNETSANPNTTLLRCEIYRSCRFQSAVTIDDCDISALSYFRCENLEGPISTNSVIKNSTLYVDGVVKTAAVAISTYLKKRGTVYEPNDYPLEKMLFQNNIIKGDFRFQYSQDMAIMNNTFIGAVTDINVNKSRGLLFRDNTYKGAPLNNTSQINFQNGTPISSVSLEQSSDKSAINIIQPFSHWQGYLADASVYAYSALPDDYRPRLLDDVAIDGGNYQCYELNIPSPSYPIEQISMEVFPQADSETLFFWTFLPTGGSAKLVVKATDDNGVESAVYSASLVGGSTQGHTIAIPESYYANKGNFKLYFSTGDNVYTDQILYLGNDVDIPLSLDQKSKKELKLSLSPVPAISELNIHGMSVISWKIISIQGLELMSGSATRINVSNLNQGIYFILIDGNEGSQLVKRFLKQ